MYPPPHTRKKEEKDQLKRQSALSFLIKSLSHTHKHTLSVLTPLRARMEGKFQGGDASVWV